MGEYSKNIAILHQLKGGFSSDGAQLSGIVKAEKYSASLKVEFTLINFAPLTEGRYVCAISDGKYVCILDGTTFSGYSEVDTAKGFAALVCFVNGEVSPVASAICGQFQTAALCIKEAIEKQEMTAAKSKVAASSNCTDEAVAEGENYEHRQADEGGGTVCKDKEKAQNGQGVEANEKTVRPLEEGGIVPPSSGGKFFAKMKEEIEGILSFYPKEENLCRAVENSEWVKISYDDGKFYVFGVIYGGGNAKYICYGVPAEDRFSPPESYCNKAVYIPANGSGGGYFVLIQDADTGEHININKI